MNGRWFLHPFIFELTLCENSSKSEPKINTFKVGSQSLQDTIEENPNKNPNWSVVG